MAEFALGSLNKSALKADRLKKLAAALFIVIIAVAVAYASYDSYQMTARDQIHIPIQEATDYLATHLDQNQSAVLVCAFNLLDQDMFRFYMPSNMSSDQIWQYPSLAVDAFTPNFNITEFLSLMPTTQRKIHYTLRLRNPHTILQHNLRLHPS